MHQENGSDEHRHLYESSDSRREAERQQNTAAEVGNADVVRHEQRHEPIAGASDEREDSLGIGDEQGTAHEQRDAQVDSEQVEADAGLRDDPTQCFERTLHDFLPRARAMYATWKRRARAKRTLADRATPPVALDR